jgi:hypothetical protein
VRRPAFDSALAVATFLADHARPQLQARAAWGVPGMDRYLCWFDAAHVEDRGRQLRRRLVALYPACHSARKASWQLYCAERHRRRQCTRGARFKRSMHAVAPTLARSPVSFVRDIH